MVSSAHQHTVRPKMATGLCLLALCLLLTSIDSVAPAAAAPPPGPVAIDSWVGGPYRSGSRLYQLSGEPLRINGRVRGWQPDQKVRVRVYVDGVKVRVRSVPLTNAGGGTSRFTVRLTIWKTGRLTARVVHGANAVMGPGSASPQPVRVYSAINHFGSRGTGVGVLHSMLHRLGYWAPSGNTYTAGTGKAVLAFRKVNRMARIETASPTIYRMLHHGKGRMGARHPELGVHLEADLTRQVLGFFDGKRATEVHVTSSGKPSTPTVLGTYRFYMREPGTNSHGMVYSTYFHNGYAVHGYAELPTYAASHGCLRVWVPNAIRIYNRIRIGEWITVYH